MFARLRAMTRRQRVLLAAAAGAAAAGAAVALSWHLETWREQERLVAARVLEQQREEEARDRSEEKKCAPQPPRRAHCGLTPRSALRRLHEHFDSIQRISDTTTLPSLLPALRERLYRLVDVDTPTARLIAARGAEALPPAEKYAAWEELAVLSACPRSVCCVAGSPRSRVALAATRPNALTGVSVAQALRARCRRPGACACWTCCSACS